jgi:hypothetical protein
MKSLAAPERARLSRSLRLALCAWPLTLAACGGLLAPAEPMPEPAVEPWRPTRPLPEPGDERSPLQRPN